MSLFQLGHISLHSGKSSDFKIDCDALSQGDVDCVAYLLARRIPPFAAVEGVPSGGIRLADAMRYFQTNAEYGRLLIVDDVLTTGGSMEAHRKGRDAIGAVLFARGPLPSWVTALFTMTASVALLAIPLPCSSQTFDHTLPIFTAQQTQPPAPIFTTNGRPADALVGSGPIVLSAPVQHETGQIEVTFKCHNDLQPIIGRGKQFTVCLVSLTSDYSTIKVVSRERIMRLAPGITEIPGRAAEDLVNRQVAKDPHSFAVRLIDGGIPLAATGATTYGLTKKQNVIAGVGLAMALIGLLRAGIASHAPNAQPYLGDLLPAQVSLAALGSATYAVLASYQAAPQTLETGLTLP